MNLRSAIAAVVRGREVRPLPVTEDERGVWPAEGSDEWTVDGTVQLMIANGYDEKEIAEFRRSVKG